MLPGETKVYAFFVGAKLTRTGAFDAAMLIDTEPAFLTTGMSQAEIDATQNWGWGAGSGGGGGGPTLDSCFIAPSTTPYVNSTLVAVPVNPSVDTSEVIYNWKVNGAPQGLSTDGRLDSSAFTTSDSVEVDCTPSTGASTGSTVTSSAVTIQSTASPITSAAASGLWNMVSAPLQTGDHLADDFTTLYEWNEGLQSYSGGTGISKPTGITPGRGYWGFVDTGEPDANGGREMDATGTAVSGPSYDLTGLTFTAGPNFSGRHLLGNPYNESIHWGNVEVRETGIGSYVSIGQASVNGWIENNIWMRYDNIAGQYLPLVGGGVNGQIHPWEGFWVKALTTIDIRFNTGGAPPPPPPVTLEGSGLLPAVSEDAWTVSLSATAGQLRDDYNAFGVAPDANDGWDYHDATDGGTMNAAHVVLSFDAGIEDTLAQDIRPDDDAVSWAVTVDAVDSGPVTLTWETVPSSYFVTFVDSFTGTTIVMNDTQTYTYTPESNAEDRAFAMTAIAQTHEPASRAAAAPDNAATGGCTMVHTHAPTAPMLLLLIALGATRIRRGRA